MSKASNWVYMMQEDAYNMTLTKFTNAYGEANESVWHDVQREADITLAEFTAEEDMKM